MYKVLYQVKAGELVKIVKVVAKSESHARYIVDKFGYTVISVK